MFPRCNSRMTLKHCHHITSFILRSDLAERRLPLCAKCFVIGSSIQELTVCGSGDMNWHVFLVGNGLHILIKWPVFCGFLKETVEQVTCFECGTAEMVACLIIQEIYACIYVCVVVLLVLSKLYFVFSIMILSVMAFDRRYNYANQG